jgi:WD40 repeat protein
MSIQVERVAKLTGHSGGIYSFVPYQEDTFFAASSDMHVSEWSLQTFESTGFTIRVPSQAYSLCLLKEKNILLIGTFKGDIHVVDLLSKQELKLLRNHSAAVLSMCYHTTNESVLAASADGSVSCIETKNFTTTKLLKLCNEKVRSVRMFQQNDFIVCSGDGKVRVLEGDSLNTKLEYAAHELSSNIGIYVAKLDSIISGGRDAHLKQYYLNEQRFLQDIPAHNYALYDLLWIEPMQLLVSASRDKTIKLWNADTLDFHMRINKENHDGHTGSVNCLLYHHGYLLSGSDDRSIMVWRLSNGC